VVVGLLIAACGDGSVGGGGDSGGEDAAEPQPSVGPSQSEAAECAGEPLKFTSIAALTGPLGGAGAERARIGLDAALNAVNRECALGRPLEVEICDDAADVNRNLACGREAASNGSLAILSYVGSFDDGVAASGLPGIFLWGTSAFELTNANAYSSISGIIVGMGGVSAAQAAGATDFLLVLPESPALQFVATQVEQLADLLEIELETIYFPGDTTDYAPLAAQIAERDPTAIGMLPAQPVVMMNALAAEGITPESHIMSVASIVMTPEVVEELGDVANGLLVVSPVVPPTDTDNAGIAELRSDLEANGQDPDDPNVDFGTVVSWSNIKKLEEALLALDPSVVASLDSASLVDAIVAHPADRPEAAAYDFSANQLPEFPDMAGFRIFTREVVILELQDGQYNVVSDGFVDMLHPPTLE
jgi:ABC-type branched-subunit amino acid transport system substrate-binding protein